VSAILWVQPEREVKIARRKNLDQLEVTGVGSHGPKFFVNFPVCCNRISHVRRQAMSDRTLSEDQIVELIVWASVFAHLGLIVWYSFRRNLAPVLAVNLLVSGGVMAYWVPRLSELFHYVDMVGTFVAFELAVIATSIAAFAKLRVPRALILAEFVGNAILSACALYFVLTFTITRLM
jgi:hypothetical protein